MKRTIYALAIVIFSTCTISAQYEALRGGEAIEQLKQTGQYDGLIDAVKSARMEDGFADFPSTENAFSQTAKLFAADGASFDNFGFSVAISGHTAIVGAYQHSPGGAAYVFVRNNSVWTLQQKLTASDAGQFDGFGFSVAIDGDTAIVGADQDNIGMNNEQGSAYIFVRSGTTWTEQQKLTASDGDGNDFFGCSVSIDGETVVVGAYGGILAADEHRGAAYVFVRSGTTWTQQQKLTASDGEITDGFGFSVAISGESAIVGSWMDANGSNNQQGSAYVFVRSGTTWTQQQKLLASDGTSADEFGISSAIDGDTAIVGAFHAAHGSNPNQGAAYVYVRSGTVWTEQQKLTASDGMNLDEFGRSVAILGNTAVVGASDDNGGSNVGRGSAYIFTRSGTTWTEQQHLFASDETAGAHFGIGVSISGSIIIVGAVRADVAAPSSFANDQGAAYIFIPRVFIGGRILTQGGSGVPNASVQLTLANGSTLTVRSTSFGYYLFENLEADQTVTISVTSKRYTFTPQMVMLSDNISDFDIIAQ